jgi:hypothetical protein
LTALDDEGAIVEAEFIRPDWWIEENGIAAGELMPLAIEELGLSGYATIQTVEDCGPIARGDGSVVTGRFTTSRVNVIVRLTVAGPDGSIEVIEGTTVHPIWSVDRNDWIQLSELQEGEHLQAAYGIATVVSIAIVSTNVPVYNIEVHGEHVYQVGDLGVVVHNACETASLLGGGSHLIANSRSSGLVRLGVNSLHVSEAYVQGHASTAHLLSRLRGIAQTFGKDEIVFEGVSFLNYSLRDQIAKHAGFVMNKVGDGPFGEVWDIVWKFN